MPAKKPKMSRLSNEGRETTSGVLIGPASKFVMDNESERMVEARGVQIYISILNYANTITVNP